MTSTQFGYLYPTQTQFQDPNWRAGQVPFVPRDHRDGSHWSLLLTSAAVVALGALTWYYLGSDIRRYIKISTM